MQWIDGQLGAGPRLAQEVDELLDEMKIEQELIALRERRGLSQREYARLLGTSQPYVAKLESGRIKNLGLRTLLRCARALGGTVTLKVETRRRITAPARRSRSRAGKKPA
jgi:transcriptional regulator with XRE-family HTH domain